MRPISCGTPPERANPNVGGQQQNYHERVPGPTKSEIRRARLCDGSIARLSRDCRETLWSGAGPGAKARDYHRATAGCRGSGGPSLSKGAGLSQDHRGTLRVGKIRALDTEVRLNACPGREQVSGRPSSGPCWGDPPRPTDLQHNSPGVPTPALPRPSRSSRSRRRTGPCPLRVAAGSK